MDDAEFDAWLEGLCDNIDRMFRRQTRFLVGLILAWGMILGMIIRLCR